MRQVTWKSLLITQPLLPRFTSRRHPNPKSKTTNSADYLFCQTVCKATSKSLKAHQLAPRFTSLRHLNRKTKMAKPANDHACQTLRQVTPKSCQAQPLVPRFTFPRHLNLTTKIAEPYFQGENLTPSDFKSYRQAWENSLPRPMPSSRVRTNWREQESACPLRPTEKPRSRPCVSTVCLFL